MRTNRHVRASLLSIAVAAVLAVVGLFNASPAPAAEPTVGNNLSVPVIWSESVPITLQGTYGTPVFDGATAPALDGSGTLWLNGVEANLWQAQTANATAPVDISWIDWGDNLTSKSLSTTGQIRVETKLLEDLPSDAPMTGFEMKLAEGSTTGSGEIWGTTKVETPNIQAVIYTANARLTIQRMTSDPSSTTLTWNKTTGQWEGSVVDTTTTPINLTVWSTTDGSGGYAAEVNLSGGLVYGYNWKPGVGGYYRVTYSLDGQNAPQALNTFITSATQLVASTETEGTTIQQGGPGGGGETGGGATPQIDPTNNLTYIDLLIGGDTPTTTPTTTPIVTATPTGTPGQGYSNRAHLPIVFQSASMKSGVQVQNLSATTANAEADYYDAVGSLVTTQSFQVAPNSSVTLFGSSMAAPDGFKGSAVVSADQPIQVVANMLGANPTTGEAYNGISSPSTIVNVPLFQQDNGGYNTSLYIENTANAASNVTVTFNQGGTQVSQKTFPLAANGSVTVDATNDGITTKFVGSATVMAQQPVAVVANQTNGSILFSYSGAGAGSPTLYAPLIMTNNSGWTTGFQVQNAGTQTTTVSLFLNGGSSAVATANLNPGQSVTWYPVPGTTSASKFVGSATVTSSNGQPLLGVVNELDQTTGQGMSYSTFSGGTQTVDMPLIMYNNSGYYTGEQIQNVGSIPATVDFKVNGTVINTQVIQPGASYTWYGTNLIPNGGKVAGAQAVAREAGAQIVGMVNEITNPQQSGDTSFAYEGFSQ